MRCAALAVLLLAPTAGAGEQLTVVSATPPPNSMAGENTSVSITFDRIVDAATVDALSVAAYGRWSGMAGGAPAVSGDGLTVTLDPPEPFSCGEVVMVVLSHDLAGDDGSPMRSAGYSFQFMIRTLGSDLDFTQTASMTTRTIPGESSRAYGGVASDLNNDGFCDITTVNEDTADLRVFMNQGGGTGVYDPFLQPTFPVGAQASPSETADFDRDGNVDICVANIIPDSISILLGNGDGTYGRQQQVDVGLAPRGIAVLDMDGDGDLDIANTNFSSSNCCVLLNDGNGVFGLPSFFEAGGSGEYSMAAADMDEDGIMDLVVGTRSSEQMLVLRGNGDATFTNIETVGAGGASWMIAVGDTNADGHVDVSSANSFDNNASILTGDGTGQLALSQTMPTDPFPLATDLGDLDGDGDLDWVTSSFGGDWRLFRNDNGVFVFDQEFPAPAAASCALVADIDNDRDADLVLIDEIADVVIIMNHDGTPIAADVNGDGAVNVLDLLAVLQAFGPCAPCDEDVNGDGAVNVLDLLAVLQGWG